MSEVLGVMVALLIGLIGIPGFMHYEKAGIDNAKIATTATQLKQISDATQQYVQANAIAIEGVATATSPATITVAMLQATGYLAPSVSAANPYGQTWQAQALQPVAGQLQVLVMPVGGISVPAKDLSKLAALAGQQGGFIPYTNQFGAGSTCSIAGSPCAMGAYGGWQVSLTNYANPGAGYVGALLNFNNGTLTNNYLYRNAVPGNPSLNTMNTPLIMAATETTGTACSPMGAIAQDGYGNMVSCPVSGVWTAVSGTWKSPVANFGSLPVTGNLTGDVRLTNDVQRAYAWNGASWMALAVDQNGNLTVPGTFSAASGADYIDSSGNLTLNQGSLYAGYVNPGWAVETWGCTANGLTAKAAYDVADGWAWNGKPLVCQAGAWKNLSGGSAYLGAYSQPVGQIGCSVGSGGNCNTGNVNLGWHNLCNVGARNLSLSGNNGLYWAIWPVAGPDAQGRYQWYAYVAFSNSTYAYFTPQCFG